jgi:6-phosphogluconolactonase
MTKKILLDEINIPNSNVHRIRGEANPETEVKRYGKEINQIVYSKNILPKFDWILLGLGEDGHTASLFPDSGVLENTNSISAIASHPQTKQKRITLTLPVLNEASIITFLVSGRSKAQMVEKIFLSDRNQPDLPASLVKPVRGEIEWFFDKDAAERLT